MRIVDDDGIGVGNIDTRLNDGGGQQNVIGAFDKVEHDFFELLAIHLAVPNSNAHSWTQALDHAGEFFDIRKSVIDKKHLAAAPYLISNGIAYLFFVKRYDIGQYRLAIWRRRINDAEVTGTHQRKLQGARYGRCSKGEGVYGSAECFEFVLDGNAKLLFFVDDHKTEVLELDPFGNQRMGTN